MPHSEYGNVGIFKELLLDIKVLKVGHNINFDLLFLNLNGYRTVGPYFDTQIYFHFQNPYESSKLKDLGERILKRKVTRLKDIMTNKESKGYIKIGTDNTKGYSNTSQYILKCTKSASRINKITSTMTEN